MTAATSVFVTSTIGASAVTVIVSWSVATLSRRFCRTSWLVARLMPAADTVEKPASSAVTS